MDAQSGGYAGASAGSATDPFGTASAGAGAQSGGTQGVAAQGAAVLDQAKDTAQHLAGQVKEQVGQRAGSAFDQGKTRAADSLDHVAQTLRQATQQLRETQEMGVGQYVDRAAEQIERFSGYLRTADVHDMADRVEDAARQQPAIFLGGMLALGLAGARFLKSSRRNAAAQRTSSSSYAGYRGYPALEGGGSAYGAGSYGAGSYGTGASGAGSYGAGSYGAGSYGAGASSGGASVGGTSAGLGDLTGSSGGSGLGTAPLGGADPFDRTGDR